MDITLRRTAVSILLAPFVCVGLMSCASSKKVPYETGAAGVSSPGPSGTFPGAAFGGDTMSPSTGGAAITDSSAAPSEPSSPPAVRKPGYAGRHSTAVTLAAKPLKREGLRCVALKSTAPSRSDFSISPIGINPCGAGSMTLPTMVPRSVAGGR